jgi:transcription antitermination factor NusG
MWVAAHLMPRREALALHCLKLAGYVTYFPRIRERRVVRGRKVDVTPALFPSYAFVVIEAQWHRARWSPGVLSIIMDGERPARVADKVIAGIRAREIRGLVELPPRLRRGDPVRVTRGLLEGFGGLYAGQTAQERVLILLARPTWV